jgi:intraflagellar transport protein 122
MNKILKEQAEWTKETGDWKTAGDLFVTCGEYRKAIELYGNNKNVEGLVDVCRLIDKSDNADNIQLCAQYFRKLKHHGGAKEAYLKLNDLKSLM